jgi:hypothetical protein
MERPRSAVLPAPRRPAAMEGAAPHVA